MPLKHDKYKHSLKHTKTYSQIGSWHITEVKQRWVSIVPWMGDYLQTSCSVIKQRCTCQTMQYLDSWSLSNSRYFAQSAGAVEYTGCTSAEG